MTSIRCCIYSWVDDHLKWDPSEFGDLKQIHMGSEEIWKPDILLYNNADPTLRHPYGSAHFVVEHDGTVLWVPPAHLEAFCKLGRSSFNSFRFISPSYSAVFHTAPKIPGFTTELNIPFPQKLRFWPLDGQTCKLKFGSWTSHGDQIDLAKYKNMTTVEYLNFYTKNRDYKFRVS